MPARDSTDVVSVACFQTHRFTHDDKMQLVRAIYSCGNATDVVQLVAGDVERTNEGEYLNDNLVDFWLRYVCEDAEYAKKRSSEAKKGLFHVCSSHFFS